MDIKLIENDYKLFLKNISYYLPDGITNINLNVLNHFDLLNNFSQSKFNLSYTFNIIEADEKITLINDHFIVWIVPHRNLSMPITYVLIARAFEQHLHLEIAFSTSGVFNNSRLVLRILEKFLQEIEETEIELKTLFLS